MRAKRISKTLFTLSLALFLPISTVHISRLYVENTFKLTSLDRWPGRARFDLDSLSANKYLSHCHGDDCLC